MMGLIRAGYLKPSTSFDFYQSCPQKSKKLRLLTLVKDSNRKHAKVLAKSNLDTKLNKLFDVSACRPACSLETVSCSDARVYCKLVGCKQEHILCPTNLKVPLAERAYLGDRRSKAGPKGSF